MLVTKLVLANKITCFGKEMICGKCILLRYNVCVQFIQQAIRRDFNNVDEILNPPEGQDEGVWKYEHLRLHTYCDNLFC